MPPYDPLAIARSILLRTPRRVSAAPFPCSSSPSHDSSAGSMAWGRSAAVRSVQGAAPVAEGGGVNKPPSDEGGGAVIAAAEGETGGTGPPSAAHGASRMPRPTSSQAPHPSLPPSGESSLIPLLRLSPPNPRLTPLGFAGAPKNPISTPSTPTPRGQTGFVGRWHTFIGNFAPPCLWEGSRRHSRRLFCTHLRRSRPNGAQFFRLLPKKSRFLAKA